MPVESVVQEIITGTELFQGAACSRLCMHALVLSFKVVAAAYVRCSGFVRASVCLVISQVSFVLYV
jgi:hypothetical protein